MAFLLPSSDVIGSIRTQEDEYYVTTHKAADDRHPSAGGNRSHRFRPPGGGFYGPAFYGPGWYGWYDPGWAPYGYAYGPNAGSVKIDTKLKDTAVYVDGGYAGTVGQLKTFHLRAGEHNLDLRGPDGRSFYQEKVTILAGKTLTVHP